MSSNRVMDPRAAERRRSLLLTLAAVTVLVVVAAVVIIVTTRGENSNSNAANDGLQGRGGEEVPTVVTDNGAIRLTGAPAGTTPPVIVTITEDFQCPACAQFETVMGPALAPYHSNPDVAVDYISINMLDRASTTQYSTRAANASLCVAEKTGKDRNFSTWMEYHNMLFHNQPAEGGAGLADAELIRLAEEVGVDDISSCVQDVPYKKWITENSEKVMSEPGFTGTPNVRINGEVVQVNDGADLQNKINAAVEAAK